jgi:hypothetical protein
VKSWVEALDWLLSHGPGRPIAEIQYWGHGKWGEVFVDRESLDASALQPGHPLFGRLSALRERLLPGGHSLWWFRTCETFGAHRGQQFARAWADFMDARVAGHTHIIGPWQSGLYEIHPGQEPFWSPEEGILEGDPVHPRRASWSRPGLKNTIFCLQSSIPNTSRAPRPQDGSDIVDSP